MSNRDPLWGDRAGTLVLDGPNFSGRTDLLRSATGLGAIGSVPDSIKDADSRRKSPDAVYLGPEVYNSISALAATVAGELRLHSGMLRNDRVFGPLIAGLDLDRLGNRNPFTLSGGEQACLATACALLLEPRLLAIDGALEQMDDSKKECLAGWLKLSVKADRRVVICDNRLDEADWQRVGDVIAISDVVQVDYRHASKFTDLDDEADIDALRPLTAVKLSLEGIDCSYGKTPVLRDVSITLEPGMVHVFEGPNGSGKSTLAKTLAGVHRPSRGRILANGIDAKPWKRPGRGVALHFQNPDVQLFETSIEREVGAGALTIVKDASEGTRRSEAAMRICGLSALRAEHPLDMPFVIRKRTALAATFAMARPWLIIDEPTLGQDKRNATAIARILERLAAVGAGVIVISHSRAFRNRPGWKRLVFANRTVTDA